MSVKERLVTQKHLRQILKYKKKKGLFIWKKNFGRRFVKDHIAGWKDSTGYRSIMINGYSYLEHRLAFLYVKGYFPEKHVDHINGIKHDNRWRNLREVSVSCNMRNAKIARNNKTGVKGISYRRRDGAYVAGIGYKNKWIIIKQTPSFVEAVLYRLAAEQCLKWTLCDNKSTTHQFAVENKLCQK